MQQNVAIFINIAYFHFFSAGQPYCSVKFVSLRTGDEIHSINYKTLTVQNVECNKRYCIIWAATRENLSSGFRKK